MILERNSRDQIIIIFCDLIKWMESMPRAIGGLGWWVVFRVIHLAAGSWTDRSKGEAERLVRKPLQYPGRKDEAWVQAVVMGMKKKEPREGCWGAEASRMKWLTEMRERETPDSVTDSWSAHWFRGRHGLFFLL